MGPKVPLASLKTTYLDFHLKQSLIRQHTQKPVFFRVMVCSYISCRTTPTPLKEISLYSHQYLTGWWPNLKTAEMYVVTTHKPRERA